MSKKRNTKEPHVVSKMRMLLAGLFITSIVFFFLPYYGGFSVFNVTRIGLLSDKPAYVLFLIGPYVIMLISALLTSFWHRTASCVVIIILNIIAASIIVFVGSSLVSDGTSLDVGFLEV